MNLEQFNREHRAIQRERYPWWQLGLTLLLVVLMIWLPTNTGTVTTWARQGVAFFHAVYVGTGTICKIQSGSGTPEGAVTGNVCDIYLRTNGGGASTLYVKESGTGNTGWVAPSGGSGDVTAASTFGTDNRLIRSDGTGKGVQSSGITIDDSDNITGLKLNCESSGNDCVFTSIEKYVTAGCQAGVPTLGMNTMTGLAPTAVCITGTNVVRAAAQFPDADGEYGLQIDVPLLPGFTGVVDFYGKWRTAATSGDIVLQIQWACTADGEVANDTWATAATTTETAKGTTLQFNTWSITGVTLTGCADGEDIMLRIMRQRTNGSDTLSGTFDLLPFYAVFRGTK